MGSPLAPCNLKTKQNTTGLVIAQVQMPAAVTCAEQATSTNQILPPALAPTQGQAQLLQFVFLY